VKPGTSQTDSVNGAVPLPLEPATESRMDEVNGDSPWLESEHSVHFSALTLRLSDRKSIDLCPKSSLLKQVEEDKPTGTS